MNTPKPSAFAGLKSTMRIAPAGPLSEPQAGRKEASPGRERVNDSPTQRSTKTKSAKRGHPDYQPVSTFILKPLHRAVRVELVQENDRDLADLLDELLRAWLARKGIAV